MQVDDDGTLKNIKELILDYSSNKVMFNDESILSEIDNCKSALKSDINSGEKISDKLLDFSKNIEEIKLRNDKLGIEECTKCIRILDRIKKDIQVIKYKEVGILKKIQYLRISGIFGLFLLVILYIKNKIY